MLKKAKSDNPKPDKPKGDKPKGAQQTYFWTAFLEKRKKKKMGPVRESALPKQPMSREDRIKLIVSGVIVLLIPLIVFLMMKYNAAHPPPPPKTG